MIPRTFTLLFRHPELLLNHVEAYGELMVSEVEGFKSGLLRKLFFGVLAAAAIIVALSVGGVALMLGLSGMLAPHWSLWAVPLGLLVIAILALLLAMRPVPLGFAQTRAQFKEDVAWFRQRDELARNPRRA